MRTNKILGARVITNIFNNSVFLCPSCRPTNSIIAPKAHCAHCVCVCVRAHTHARTHARTHTHTHTRLTALFPGLPRWAGTRKVNPIWILLKQETVSGSGISWAICKSASHSRQITMPVPPPLKFFTGRMPLLPPNQQRQSTEGRNSIYVTRRKPNMHRTAERQRLSVSVANVYLCLCLACSRFGAEIFTLPGILRDKSVSCTAPHIPSVANSTDRSTTAGITTNREKPII